MQPALEKLARQSEVWQKLISLLTGIHHEEVQVPVARAPMGRAPEAVHGAEGGHRGDHGQNYVVSRGYNPVTNWGITGEHGIWN